MSFKRTSAVLEQSQSKGNDRLTLVVLAGNANDEGYCWPGYDTLQKSVNVSRGTLTACLARLEGGGDLYIDRRQRRGNKYLVLPGLTDDEICKALHTYFLMTEDDAKTTLAEIGERRDKFEHRTINKFERRTNQKLKISSSVDEISSMVEQNKFDGRTVIIKNTKESQDSSLPDGSDRSGGQCDDATPPPASESPQPPTPDTPTGPEAKPPTPQQLMWQGVMDGLQMSKHTKLPSNSRIGKIATWLCGRDVTVSNAKGAECVPGCAPVATPKEATKFMRQWADRGLAHTVDPLKFAEQFYMWRAKNPPPPPVQYDDKGRPVDPLYDPRFEGLDAIDAWKLEIELQLEKAEHRAAMLRGEA